ncbi:TraX protein [Ruminococcaceae bacterium YRB3002]|nr:TraX protein [Ruminococcaceae bacterium YRB3002]
MQPKYRILSGSVLKTIALVCMIIDHIGAHIMPYLSFAVTPLFSVGSTKITLYLIMRLIGRIAFPIYCFLLTEGYRHTHDRKKYGINLFLFALVSEIPWNLVHGGTLLYQSQNVFFTLWLGFIAICFYENYKDDFLKLSLSMVLLFIVSFLLKADYGLKGVALILLIHVLRSRPVIQAFIGSALLNYPFAAVFAFIPINMYNGKRGFIRNKVTKYIYYLIYPVHLLVIWIIVTKYFK